MASRIQEGGGGMGSSGGFKAKVKAKVAVKTAAKANARGLKAANKPLSKGNAKAIFKGGDSANVLKNSPPARANRTRGGSLRTLRAQGKTGSTSS